MPQEKKLLSLERTKVKYLEQEGMIIWCNTAIEASKQKTL